VQRKRKEKYNSQGFTVRYLKQQRRDCVIVSCTQQQQRQRGAFCVLHRREFGRDGRHAVTKPPRVVSWDWHLRHRLKHNTMGHFIFRLNLSFKPYKMAKFTFTMTLTMTLTLPLLLLRTLCLIADVDVRILIQSIRVPCLKEKE